LDEWILQNRDRSRYKAVDRRERTVQTVIGVAVTFKRRYYLDSIGICILAFGLSR